MRVNGLLMLLLATATGCLCVCPRQKRRSRQVSTSAREFEQNRNRRRQQRTTSKLWACDTQRHFTVTLDFKAQYLGIAHDRVQLWVGRCHAASIILIIYCPYTSFRFCPAQLKKKWRIKGQIRSFIAITLSLSKKGSL
ncbi:hypothetical protein BDB00DRAFT_319928 [Zychaea mexicana]|uniref:uncharacterized protein n=1 Tax=Zychaea mexicana TaxID=64656 RepID=UPI0022FEEAB4|nr:uncharacterized protein BDB00DRAFT_319928 [Zychaea mexicana]KAI9494303.1 hypothetical protein BDB00DRAFT_319928 [Zychaea mexicana]